MLFSTHHVPECVSIISGTQDPSIHPFSTAFPLKGAVGVGWDQSLS